jgi:hypothetical protein
MISDKKKTDKLAKVFAFSDVIAVGNCFKARKIWTNICPVSNAGLSSPDIGFNTKKFQFGLSIHF